MKDLIERQAALDAIRNIKANYCETADDQILLIDKAMAMTELMMLPSAQPEIIHCCDCKYSSKDMIFDEYFCSKKTRSNCVAEDHYCGYAKRWEE